MPSSVPERIVNLPREIRDAVGLSHRITYHDRIIRSDSFNSFLNAISHLAANKGVIDGGTLVEDDRAKRRITAASFTEAKEGRQTIRELVITIEQLVQVYIKAKTEFKQGEDYYSALNALVEEIKMDLRKLELTKQQLEPVVLEGFSDEIETKAEQLILEKIRAVLRNFPAEKEVKTFDKKWLAALIYETVAKEEPTLMLVMILRILNGEYSEAMTVADLTRRFNEIVKKEPEKSTAKSLVALWELVKRIFDN